MLPEHHIWVIHFIENLSSSNFNSSELIFLISPHLHSFKPIAFYYSFFAYFPLLAHPAGQSISRSVPHLNRPSTYYQLHASLTKCNLPSSLPLSSTPSSQCTLRARILPTYSTKYPNKTRSPEFYYRCTLTV